MKYAFFFSLLVFVGCDQTSKHPSRVATLPENLQVYLKKSVEELNIPGIAVAVTKDDSVIFSSAFGVKNIDTKEPITTNNIFHWASVSKTFVAAAILQMAERGEIRLDGKLTHYLPFFRLRKGNYKDITIKQMLNHTSGIGDVDDYEWDKPQYDVGAPERYVRSLDKDKMLFSPGTSWE